MSRPVLMYFADPMCSWCWGFLPIIETLRGKFAGHIDIALIMGGLRPGTTDPVTMDFREEIFHHWESVQTRTGQHFRFDDALPDGFVYDTEPASRAVVTAAQISPQATFTMFKLIQSAFYTEARDVTAEPVLGALAETAGINPATFSEVFNAEITRQQTAAHFQRSRQFGVRGFPTTILHHGDDYTPLATGYCELQPLIEATHSLLKSMAVPD